MSGLVQGGRHAGWAAPWLLIVLARTALAVVLAAGIAVPILTYSYAHQLVLLGGRAPTPAVHLPAADLARYRAFAAGGPPVFVVVGYDDLSRNAKVDPTRPRRTVAVATFAAQLAMLRAAGLTSVTGDQLTAYLRRGAPLPAHAVLIAFDGGHQRDWTEADSVLAHYGFTAVVFIDTSTVAGRGSGRLSWTQLSAMTASKRWTVGLDLSGAAASTAIDAHGGTGPALLEHAWLAGQHRAETTAEYQRRIRGVLDSEAADLARHGFAAPQLVSYPVGPSYPLVRVKATFDELAAVVNGQVSAGVLSVQPDEAVRGIYQRERLLPR
ncbi:MAG TPA: hypothetical protein VGN54_09595, partial [Mycobacteriales bacterium]|nr:hypothetical protein [Mycobacteriales bacterium]